LPQWGVKNASFSDSLTAASVFGQALATAAEAEGNDELRVLDETVETADKTPVRLLGRVGRRGMALWLQDKRSTCSAKDEPGEIKGVELHLPGLVEGNYKLVWLDTWTGRVVSADIYKAPAKHVDKPLEPTVLRAPAFKRDLALLVCRKDER
jgi:hypothetical protein